MHALLGVANFSNMSPNVFLASILIAMLLTVSMPDASAQEKGKRPERVDIVILGGTIVTMDEARQVIEDGGLALKGGRIVAIGPRVEIVKSFTGRETLNATDRIIIPGLINGHTHIPMVTVSRVR